MLSYFRKIWYVLGDSRKKLPSLVLLFVVSSVAETLGIGLLGPFFAIVSNPELIQSNPILQSIFGILNLQSDELFIVFLCAFIVTIFIVKSILYFFSKFYILHFSHFHRGKVVERLNKAYLNSDYSYFIGKNSANLLNNITAETQSFCYKILLSLLYGVSNFIILTFLLTLMLATDSLLLIATLAALAPVFLLTYAMKNKLRVWGRAGSESMRSIIRTLNHGLGGFKETRVIGCSPYFESQMAEYTHQYAHAASLKASFDMLPRILIETTLVTLILLFIALSQLFLTRSSDSIVASLSVFAVASIRLLPAASQAISTLGSLQSTRHVVDILYADLKEAEVQLTKYSLGFSNNTVKKFSSPSSTMSFKDHIRLDNILHTYLETNEPAINNISLKINKGESIAFIGKSGAGKTTLVDIILGLLTPQNGDITVDGVSIYSDLRAWQNVLAYIPQSIFLLDETIERNIAFGVPDHLINHEKLQQSIVAAQLEELVIQLPSGIHTRVGERGVMLSGGQRQRIGIARALYHERDILVLDEATSALDNETERRVSKSIQDLSGNKTVIIIAHRLSTVEHCDKIHLLEKGQIIKSGSFQDVVAYR